jgi:multiple antibiotic resistance protein
MSVILALLRASVTLLIITDPIGLIPIFVALTQYQTDEERRTILRRATLVGYVLLIVFTFAGSWILGLFNISLSDFKIAGGILLLVIALNITLQAHYGQDGNVEPGVVPIAVPLLVGPGAITTTIVLIGTYGLWITVGAVLINLVADLIIFRYIGLLFRLLGRTGSDVIAKIMGMLLAAIAVEFIRQGLQEVFHF